MADDATGEKIRQMKILFENEFFLLNSDFDKNSCFISKMKCVVHIKMMNVKLMK